MASDGKVRFEEIEVERINIVDRDGTLRLVIANTERSPDVVLNGRTYPREGGRSPGLIFFNDEGTECGGLIYGGQRKEGKYSAGASLTFDQFEQDQVVQLHYDDENGDRTYGLRIMDRPTRPLAEFLPRWEAIVGMPDGPAKEAAIDEFQAGFGACRRVFVGRNRGGEAIVVLADSKGRDRIRMRVDQDDVPRLEFLDEKGEVVYRLPPDASPAGRNQTAVLPRG